MLTLAKGSKVTLKVDSLSHGGSGVGRHDNLVFFVPFAAPGDLVTVSVLDIKKNFVEASLVEILEPSAQRVKPPCPVFGRCGGCQWQHVNYTEQLKQKEGIVAHNLKRIAKEEGVTILPILPSPLQFNYRNRAQFRKSNLGVGFYERKSHNIVSIDECLLLDQKINSELKNIRNSPSPKSGEEKIEVFLTPDEKVVSSKNRGHSEETGFSQVNSLQNINMQKVVCEFLGKPSEVETGESPYKGNLLDLYCGNGNFSFPLNKLGWRIFGVDSSRQAIREARDRATETTFFSAEDCVVETRRLARNGRKFEAILLDPPRIGADSKLWAFLKALDPRVMVYISCNPATFARDWARIKEKMPLKLISIQPIDMFPQTFHVELVAFAQRI